jgi:membrane-associated phospholipid phosphatase
VGKSELFLLLNTDLGRPADYFFEYFTHLGDGALWAGWLIWILVKKQKPILPLLFSSFALDTIITQVIKQVIFPNEMRPSEAIKDGSFIHYVEGVTVHSINSFPSGHTATAFTFLLLIALTTKGGWFTALAFIVACIVGYSRIYLGQHFPFDVGGGILVAVIAVSISIPIQVWFDKRNAAKKVNA